MLMIVKTYRSRAEQKETDFTALIWLAWIMATMIGCTRVLTLNDSARLVRF